MYPRLEIDATKLRENTRIISDLCHRNNLELAIVTKAYCANYSLVKELVKEDVDYLADSRIENLKNLKDIDTPKILLRIPMKSEADEVVDYCDISFNSELDTILRLNDAAKSKSLVHKIAIMVDLGDLREGYINKIELFKTVEKVLKLSNIKLIGLSTNLTCFGAIIPTEKNLGELISMGREIEEKYNINLDFISGGNSSSLYLLNEGIMPKGISNLRIGEGVVLGTESAYGKKLSGTHQDGFKLICEVVEIKDKPSIPVGTIGLDAFGNKPIFIDKGVRKRAIVAIGKQDVYVNSLIPVDSDIEIVGASSDHMILDITDSKNRYSIGDKVVFTLEYPAIMSLSTSKYVHKIIINQKVLEFNA